MATENPNNFPMPERYLQMYPLHCHIADEFIKGLWAARAGTCIGTRVDNQGAALVGSGQFNDRFASPAAPAWPPH